MRDYHLYANIKPPKARKKTIKILFVRQIISIYYYYYYYYYFFSIYSVDIVDEEPHFVGYSAINHSVIIIIIIIIFCHDFIDQKNVIFFKPVIKKALGEKRKNYWHELVFMYLTKSRISPFFKRCKRIHIVAFLVLGQGTKIGLQVSQTSL